MESIYKTLIIEKAKELLKEIRNKKDYTALANELEKFVHMENDKIEDTVLNELQNLMNRIKMLMQLDRKIQEKEEMINLFEQISNYFKEQEIRKEDLDKISNGEIFKIVEEIDLVQGKEEKNLDLFFITRKGASEYKKEHKNEYKGNLKIKVIDNKDKLLEKILRIIEKNY